jgi:hypothetical protein
MPSLNEYIKQMGTRKKKKRFQNPVFSLSSSQAEAEARKKPQEDRKTKERKRRSRKFVEQEQVGPPYLRAGENNTRITRCDRDSGNKPKDNRSCAPSTDDTANYGATNHSIQHII